MPESIKKVLQEEIDGITDNKSDQDTQKKVQYLNNVFRLPWD